MAGLTLRTSPNVFVNPPNRPDQSNIYSGAVEKVANCSPNMELLNVPSSMIFKQTTF